MLKPRFCVSLSTGVHLTPIKVTENHNMLGVRTCPSLKQVYTLLTFGHGHECRGGKEC